MRNIGASASDIAAIGITNQRETTVVWNKKTGRPVCPAIVWQCRRTAGYCDSLKERGLVEPIRRKTGLVLDAYFSATKLRWILEQTPGARAQAARGELCFGTVETWLIWKLTGGRLHVTDASNASRTMLFNIHTLQWDREILEELGIDYEMTIISAHREPDVFFDWAKAAEDKGFKVIIAGAGKAAHLPGMCAAIFPMPVIGIPMKTSDLGGVDSLYSIVQMPSGIPVATVAINGGANAGILAAKILATSDAELLAKLKAYSESLKNDVVKKAEKLEQVGYKEYLAQMK